MRHDEYAARFPYQDASTFLYFTKISLSALPSWAEDLHHSADMNGQNLRLGASLGISPRPANPKGALRIRFEVRDWPGGGALRLRPFLDDGRAGMCLVMRRLSFIYICVHS